MEKAHHIRDTYLIDTKHNIEVDHYCKQSLVRDITDLMGNPTIRDLPPPGDLFDPLEDPLITFLEVDAIVRFQQSRYAEEIEELLLMGGVMPLDTELEKNRIEVDNSPFRLTRQNILTEVWLLFV